MQKIIKKIYKCRQAIQGVKHKKILFVFFTFVLPCAYYLVLIGYFGLMGLNEDDLPEIYTILITSPFFIVPFYVALAFFSIVIFLKNIFVKILMGLLYIVALLFQSVVIVGMIYEYEILYLAGPHLIIIVAGVFIAVKLKTYEENKVRGSLEKHLY